MPLVVHQGGEVDPSPLARRRVAVIGYGNQGRAHARNLRDSGVAVLVGQRSGRSSETAIADGFDPKPVAEAAASADLIVLTLPDESAAEVYQQEIGPGLRPGQAIGFVHGFNVRFGFIQPPEVVDVVMVAPKGPGALLRSLYEAGRGLPALLAVHQDASGDAKPLALAWAAGIGSTRAAVIETTFAAETDTDLFGEQTVLCGGIAALTKAAFETLVDAGYEPEFAYLECVHELKQIADLIYEHGLSAMRERISKTALYGDVTRGPRVVGDAVRAQMRRILDEIRDGTFARQWMAEHRAGALNLRRLRAADAVSSYEQAGAVVRSWMPWLGKPAK